MGDDGSMDFGLNGDGSSLFDTGINPALFGYQTNGNGDIGAPNYSIPYDPSAPTFGIPGGGSVMSPNYNVFGTSDGSIPGIPGANLGDGSGDGSGGGGSVLSAVLRSLGIGGGSGGGNGIAQLLAAALGIGGGIFANSQNQRAVSQAIQGLTNASTQATNILGSANSAFKPYTDLGAYAANGLQNLPLTGIAGNFNSLGSGRGIKLGALTGH